MSVLNNAVKEKLLETINHHNSNYKVEALVDAFTERGFQREQLIVQAKSISKRPYRKDVSAFHTELSHNDDVEYIFFHTNRDGIYDGLPEHIFHQPIGKRAEKSKDEITAEMRRYKEEEKQARKFFLPYEQEFYHIRSTLYTLERNFESITDTSKLTNIFKRCWPILNRLDSRQGYLFFRMIPILHRIRDDFPLVAEHIGLILDVEVQLIPTMMERKNNGYVALALGEANLGEDTILGTSTHDGEMDLRMLVGPFPDHVLASYRPGGIHDGLIEALCDYFIGANYVVVIEFVCADSRDGFVLNKNTALLGFNVGI